MTNSSSQTKKAGKMLAKEILKKEPRKTALVIGLEGELGGGKTTFLQGFAKGLGIKEKILSPTFVVMKKFQVSIATLRGVSRYARSSKFQEFYHIDCYRIHKPKELLDLGFREIISCPQNIVVIEWADRIRKILPNDALILKFEFVNKGKRKIIFSAGFHSVI